MVMPLSAEKPVPRSAFAHLYPFRSKYLTINGLQYHYLDEGQGDPLLMVHGNPTWSFYFRNLISALKDHYRVIVPDHMGCGLSAKPDERQYDFRLQSRVSDLTALIDHLNPDRPLTLILHDWGGMIGLAWALDHLNQLGRLVITNTAGFFPPHGKPIPWRLRLIRTPNALKDWMVLHLNLFARGALYMAPFHSLAPEVKAGLIAPYNCPRNRLATLKFVQDIPLSSDHPSGTLVARVEKNLKRLAPYPTLILWGAHDFVFDGSYFEEWRQRLPHAQCHWFDDAGHYLLEDIPDRAVACIRKFLNHEPA